MFDAAHAALVRIGAPTEVTQQVIQRFEAANIADFRQNCGNHHIIAAGERLDRQQLLQARFKLHSARS